MLSSVVPTSCDHSFEWSLRPVIFCIKWFGGIDLAKTIGCRPFVLMGVVVLLASLSINVLCCYTSAAALLSLSKMNQSGAANGLSTANIISIGLERANIVCYTFGIHFAFFIVSLTKWKDLWTGLNDIQQGCHFDGKLYEKIRNTVLAGGVLISVHSGLSIYLSASLFQPWPSNTFRPIVLTLANILENLTISILALFCLLVWLATALFAALDDIIKDVNRFNALRLEHWRHSFNQVNQLIGHINECFGFILLVAVSSIFGNFITISFALSSGYRYKNELQMQYLLLLVKHSVILWLITYAPYRLRSKADDIKRTIRESALFSSLPNLSLKFRLNRAVMEVAQNIPHITAMGFFDVDMQLFPTLIGTTLTYLVILNQSS